jgi:hypothetical protein
MTRPLFTDTELDELKLRSSARISGMLDRGDTDAALQLAGQSLRAHLRFVEGLQGWTALVRDYLLSQGVIEADATAMTMNPGKEASNAAEVVGPLAATASDALRKLVQGGDSLAAIEAYLGFEAALRRQHSDACDTVALALSEVYRVRGIDDLEGCLRFQAEQTLLKWMPTDISRPPRVRALTWLALLRGNFAEVTLREYSDHLELVQDPCGTCGRQVADGTYVTCGKMAIVTERHPITWGRGGVPIYRTHVAVLHFILPLERLGVPWPVFACPADLANEPCRVLIFKDPYDPAAREYGQL